MALPSIQLRYIMSHDSKVNSDDALSIFGVIIAIFFGTFAILTILIHFDVFKDTRERLNAREKTMEAKGLKNLHQYQQFLHNLYTRLYVGVAYLYPSGFMGMPPGAYEDFVRIVANKHTFFSILLCDDQNLYKPYERNVNYFFVASCGFILFSFSVFLSNEYKAREKVVIIIFWNVLITNVVMTFMSELSYYLLSCPCCHKYGNRTEMRTIITYTEYALSYLFILVGIGFLLIGSYLIEAGLTDDGLETQLNFICWQYIVTLIAQWLQELLTFYFMFIDIDSETPVGKFFRGLKSITCGFMAIGNWVMIYYT